MLYTISFKNNESMVHIKVQKCFNRNKLTSTSLYPKLEFMQGRPVHKYSVKILDLVAFRFRTEVYAASYQSIWNWFRMIVNCSWQVQFRKNGESRIKLFLRCAQQRPNISQWRVALAVRISMWWERL